MSKCIVKHAKCDLYIAERAGSWARWDKRDQAMAMTREEWEKEFSPTFNRDLIQYEEVND